MKETAIRTILIIAAIGLAAGCARTPEVAVATPQGARTVSCISTLQSSTPRPVSATEVDFRVGSRTFRNILPDSCASLENWRKTDAFALEPTGSQLCAGDRIRRFDPQGARVVGLNAYPHCRLGRFVELPRRERNRPAG